MNLFRIGKWCLLVVFFVYCMTSSLMLGMAQSALTFQPGTITTIAGSGISGYSGDGGVATSAAVTSNIKGIAADSAGDVFFVDGTNNTIRVVYEGGAVAAKLISAENPTVTSPVIGNIYVIAGQENTSGTPTNGMLATSVKLTTNTGALGLDAAGDLYVSGYSSEVWIIYAGGTNTSGTNLIALEEGITSPTLGYIYRLAGSTAGSNGGDGTLASSSTVRLHGIDDIKLDSTGNLYIADQGNNSIRMISASTGFISTIAGGGGTSSGTAGLSANGAVAASSLLNQPYAVAADSFSNIYISDKNNNLIWMIYQGGSAAAALITLENPTVPSPVAGNMYIIVGGGTTTYPYGVLGTSAKLNGTTMIAIDPAGDLYLAVNGYNLIAKLNAKTGYLSVVAGTGTAGTATGIDGDGGIATSGLLNGPRGVAVDSAGRIYITDAGDLKVRKVGPQGLIAFSGQASGTTSVPQTILLTNTGSAPLNFIGRLPIFGGANAGDYALDTTSSLNTCDFSVSLQPAASCTQALTYSPLGTGASVATLTYTTDGVLPTVQITLQGTQIPGTSTVLLASAQSAANGNDIFFTATVTGSASPTGSVSFYNSASSLLGTVALYASGIATLSYRTTATGLLSISASYSGDSANAASTSSAVSVNITGSAISTTVAAASPVTISQGQNIEFTAMVTGGGSTPTGTVTFYDDSASILLGSVILDGSGIARLSTTAVPVGLNNIQVSYLGDANYEASASTISIQVNGTPVVSLIAFAAVINMGVKETFTATVSGNGATPTGNVMFYAGNIVLGTASLSSGVAILLTATLPDGTYAVTASYGGDINYLSTTSSAVAVTVHGRAFAHPGGLHTQADFDRMKTQVAAGAHPWIDDWQLLIADPQAQSTYGNHATANMGSSRQNADLDAHAAYLNAIRWRISGETAYADEAKKILNAWATKVNQVPTGTDIPGLIGISIQDFALAGETLRGYSEWSDTDFAAFQNMFTNYLYPVVNDFLTRHNNAAVDHYWANWDACNLGSLIAMGVLNDNTDWFNQGIAYYESGVGSGAINNAVGPLYNNGTLGQWQESGRDQEHAQLGVGLLGYAAQAAWNQGVDLFGYSSNRLLAGAEYVAQYNTAQSVPYTTYNNSDNVLQYYVSTNGRDRLDDRPVWELIYNHYGVLRGTGTPNTQTMAQLQRPEHGSTDHFGYGTLTFTQNATESPYPPSSLPASPTGLTATASVNQIYLNWSPIRTANGYNVLRSSNGSAYTLLANLTETTLPQYADTSVANGTAYSYEIQAVNQTGTSTASASASATPMAAGALPTGWMNTDIGTVLTAGRGQYATAGNNTYLVTGQGSGIGGTADSFNYTYTQITGNFTLTAQLENESGALSNTGLMMRETLNSGAEAVTMVLGSTGGRIAQMGSRSITGGGMSWTTGNQYTVTPVWLRLQRSGNIFTASQSSDGVNWFTVGSKTISMASTYYVGLVACSGDTASASTETSTFDNVSLNAGPKATLTVTASNASMVAGAAVPALTVNYSGFVNGDTAAVLSGAPALNTTATSLSAAGSYPISATQGTLTAANYTFSFVSGTLSVIAAPAVSLTTSSVITGSNASGYTMTITVNNTGVGTVTGLTLNAATLGSTVGTPLPQSLGSIASGASGTFMVAFPGSVGADGAGVSEKYSGTVTGGSFSASVRSVSLP